MSIAMYYLTPQMSTLFYHTIRLGSYPASIYHGFMKIILIFFIPLLVVYSLPVEVFFGRASWQAIVIGVMVTLGFLIISQIMWKLVLKHYASAGG